MPSNVAPKNVSRHCQMPPGDQDDSQLKTTGIEKEYKDIINNSKKTIKHSYVCMVGLGSFYFYDELMKCYFLKWVNE